MKVTNFDKPTIKAIRMAMDNALAKVEKEYGITISTGNARFSGNEVTFKVKANTLDSLARPTRKKPKCSTYIRTQKV